MLCPHCGVESEQSVRFCISCGSAMPEMAGKDPVRKTLTGYSPLINDPAFASYIKNSKRWSYIFASILALIVIVSFYIYGEASVEMDNPEALYIGLVIGGMFLAIALLQSLGRNRSTTWDGVVVDKQIEEKRRKRRSGNNDDYWEPYAIFNVVIKKDNGKLYTLRTEDDDTKFNYYKIGDKVRHHGGLNSIEKYDKSGDDMIFCNACASLNDIKDDYCFRCKCPLLK
ncbi:MAG: zinc-ribbon domain-containing protein [Desulfotomaculaceae bacterium]|nr:zinc-ribbon domain-containing protein [Desulfotomaculaceae bacterium]